MEFFRKKWYDNIRSFLKEGILMKKESSYFTTLTAISELKNHFEKQLEKNLNIIKVPAPLFVSTRSGLQDNLNGVEKAVMFVKGNESFEVIHSLAKWKREALGRYEFPVYKGLYTNMRAIRQDETVDNIHSLYVEQWDWEKVIKYQDRNVDYLKNTVKSIYSAIFSTSKFINRKYHVNVDLPKNITFITSQELENLYPNSSPKEREELITKKYRAVFIIGIGDLLKSGVRQDSRSPDYDDWSLNGDLLIYSDKISKAVEISSMGIRVDEISLREQLEKARALDRIGLPYHQKILKCELPYTIGGGIGKSRLFMLLLAKEHIAEVQASAWEEATLNELADKMIL